MQSGTRDDVVGLATPGARQLLGWVHDNAAALRISDLSMRYVDEGAPLSAAEQAELGEDAWRGSVELEYRYDGFDKAPARMETSVGVRAHAGRSPDRLLRRRRRRALHSGSPTG